MFGIYLPSLSSIQKQKERKKERKKEKKLRYIDQALDWMALPVGPEMFDICGRSSLIFSRDIQGIWYGG
jgi:hypothetical protein